MLRIDPVRRNPEARIGIADAISECCRDLPKSAPDFHRPMRFSERNLFLNCSAPCADVFQCHRSRIAITKNTLDALPPAPPVLARSRGLSPPFVRVTVLLERCPEGARRVDRQFFRLRRRQIVSRERGRRGLFATLYSLQRRFHSSAMAKRRDHPAHMERSRTPPRAYALSVTRIRAHSGAPCSRQCAA